MSFSRFIFYLVLVSFNSCKSDKVVSIKIGDEIAQGNISVGKDTVFNGTIRFINSNNHKLVTEASYRNGTLHGERKEYYPNGKIGSIIFYNMGKEDGLASFFDSSGNLRQTRFSFHGLTVGPLITYQDQKPKKYSFYSFDESRLFTIDYDSLTQKSIEDWKDKLFFYSENQVIEDLNAKNVKRRFFIYLPAPPEFEFIYTFCIVDGDGRIVKILKIFDQTQSWAKYIVGSEEKQENDQFAFVVRVTREGREIFSDMTQLD